MTLTKEVEEIFVNEKYHQLATSSNEGVPNICNIGGKYIRDDGKIIVVDNFMNKTIKNITFNPQVSILIRREKESYQIKGTSEYLTEGDEYKEAYKWMKSKGDKYPAKGAIIITVTEVFNAMTGANAGKKII